MKSVLLVWIGVIIVPSICFDFGNIVSGVTSGASSAITTVTGTANSLIGNASSAAGSATSSISNGASSLVNKTQTTLTSAENTLTSTANSIVSTAQNNLVQIQAQTTILLNQAVGTIRNTSSQAIAETKTTIANAQMELETKIGQFANTTENAVNTAIQTVKNEVNNIVSTIDNLSAQMCESQCTSFFNLPCFLLFRCTDKIRNFCLAILLPILIIIVLVVGCSTGLITPSCLCKTLLLVTGITCIIWALKRRKAKQQRKEQAAEKEEAKQCDNPEEPPHTEKRMDVKDEL